MTSTFNTDHNWVDIVNHVVWAVVNHNSEFAVAPALVRLTATRGNSGQIVLDGIGVPLEHYMIQTTSDLRLPFTDLAPVNAISDGTLHFENTITGNQRYYRVVEVAE